MDDKRVIQEYINNLRRRLTPYLKPGIGLSCNVYAARSGGAILEFTMGPAIENDDTFKEVSSTLSQALANIEQHAFGGNLDGFVFSSTNVILEDDRIIFIKDATPSEWSDEAAKNDVKRLLHPPRRAPK